MHHQPEPFSKARTSGELVHGLRRVYSGHTPAATVLGAADARIQPVAFGRKKRWSWDLFIWCAIVASRGGTIFAAGSAVCGAVKLRRWMQRGSVSMERGTMAHFAWRGATLGVVLSLLSDRLVRQALASFRPGLAIFLRRTAAAAAVEELSKFIALTWLCWSSVTPWCRNPSPSNSWPRSPRGIMLAGFSVGVGFMVEENSVYFPRVLHFFLATLRRFKNREDVILQVFRDFLIFSMLQDYSEPAPVLDWYRCRPLCKGRDRNFQPTALDCCAVEGAVALGRLACASKHS